MPEDSQHICNELESTMVNCDSALSCNRTSQLTGPTVLNGYAITTWNTVSHREFHHSWVNDSDEACNAKPWLHLISTWRCKTVSHAENKLNCILSYLQITYLTSSTITNREVQNLKEIFISPQQCNLCSSVFSSNFCIVLGIHSYFFWWATEARQVCQMDAGETTQNPAKFVTECHIPSNRDLTLGVRLVTTLSAPFC